MTEPVEMESRALREQELALRDLLVRADNNTIELSNGITIEIMTARWRTIRGCPRSWTH